MREKDIIKGKKKEKSLFRERPSPPPEEKRRGGGILLLKVIHLGKFFFFWSKGGRKVDIKGVSGKGELNPPDGHGGEKGEIAFFGGEKSDYPSSTVEWGKRNCSSPQWRGGSTIQSDKTIERGGGGKAVSKSIAKRGWLTYLRTLQ